MPKQTAGQRLLTVMRKKFPNAKTIKGKGNKKADKELRDFFLKVEKAHRDAINSKLVFGATA